MAVVTHSIEPFSAKTPLAIDLFNHFINCFQQVGNVHIYPTKTMIGIANKERRIAWITAIGKNFVHVIFPFTKAFENNLCFQKIAQVPGDTKQFNHHFRMLAKEDMNDEIKGFMQLAYKGEQYY